jgi:hypothetical protein
MKVAYVPPCFPAHYTKACLAFAVRSTTPVKFQISRHKMLVFFFCKQILPFYTIAFAFIFYIFYLHQSSIDHAKYTQILIIIIIIGSTAHVGPGLNLWFPNQYMLILFCLILHSVPLVIFQVLNYLLTIIPFYHYFLVHLQTSSTRWRMKVTFQRLCPAALSPRKGTHYPLDRRLRQGGGCLGVGTDVAKRKIALCTQFKPTVITYGYIRHQNTCNFGDETWGHT